MPYNNENSFYKYTNAKVTKIVLANTTFRWSSPDQFNDPFDMQFYLNEPEISEQRSRRIVEIIIERLRKDKTIDIHPTRAHCTKTKFIVLAFRKIQERMSSLDENELKEIVFSMIHDIKPSERSGIIEINQTWQNVLERMIVFCVSEVPDNLLMWSHYSENHSGVVFKLDCRKDLDSALCAAKKVRYSETMPVRLDDDQTLRFVLGGQLKNAKDVLDDLSLTKSIDWSYEKEWRCIADKRSNRAERHEDVQFFAHELSEVIFGCRTSESDIHQICLLLDQGPYTARKTRARKHETRYELILEPLQ